LRSEASENACEIAIGGLQDGLRRVRVARAKLTARFVADLFNAAGIGEWDPDTYRFVNIYNPDAALRWDSARRFSCSAERMTHPATGLNWAGASLAAALLGARLPRCAEWTLYTAPATAWLCTDPEGFYSLTNVAQSVGDTTPVETYPLIGGLFDPLGNACEWMEEPLPGPDAPASLERYVAGASWSTPRSVLETTLMRGKWGRVGTRSIGTRVLWDGPVD
jgi:formylglycine-generating enzyme required for sulfatase activity